MAKKPTKPMRSWPEGQIPLLDVEGTAHDAGVMLGYIWADALRQHARNWTAKSLPWWMDKRYAKLIAKYAPHLPDVYLGMAKGAGVPEDRISDPAMEEKTECTSFAIQPSATLDGIPISGQTKDTGSNRWFQYQVLRMKLKDAPSALTSTYPGLLFGHGFVSGGCCIFRNSMYAGAMPGLLPYFVWGILALHCRTVEDMMEMTLHYGVNNGGHCTVADERGGVVGVEWGKGGVAFLRPKHGIYTHANAVVSGPRLQKHETCKPAGRANSLHREGRLRERLEPDHGRLTAQLAYMAMCDHVGYPGSICRHESLNSLTTSAIVVEPTRGLLHASRGNPCQNWPVTYRL
jgi:isopenicillin-N N-acyltransferase like protein